MLDVQQGGPDGPAGLTCKSCNFIDKDPIIDEIRTVYQDSGANYRWVSEHSGVAPGTLTNWFSGATRRPQAATINAVPRPLGFKPGVVPFEQPAHIVPSMPQPRPRPQIRPENMRHVVKMAKYSASPSMARRCSA